MPITDCISNNDPAACVAEIVRTSNRYCADAPDNSWRILAPGVCGDCEDLALTVGSALIAYGGYQPRDLRVILTRTSQGECHAVLLAKDRIVDNGVMRAANAFRPVYTLNWKMAVSYLGKSGPGCPALATAK